MSEMVERVARALKEDRERDIRRWYASTGSCIAPIFAPWEKDSHIWMQQARAATDAFKEALSDAGLVIVPREPTEAMLSAAGRLNHPRDEEIWRAMIDAASEKP